MIEEDDHSRGGGPFVVVDGAGATRGAARHSGTVWGTVGVGGTVSGMARDAKTT
jgi:hypothetical protein